MSAKRIEHTPDPNKFDLRTHEWDAQGILVRKNLYRLHIREGNHYFERPVNSGNLWFENNQPAGRVELKFNKLGHITSKEYKFDAEHKEYSPELTGNDKLTFQLEQERSRSAELEAELLAIRGERAPVTKQPGGAVMPAPSLTKEK